MASFKKSMEGLKNTTQSATKGVTDSAGTDGVDLFHSPTVISSLERTSYEEKILRTLLGLVK